MVMTAKRRRRAARAGADWWPEEREAWRRPEKLTPSEWADRHRVLSLAWSSEPGRWRTGRTPYLREVMDSVVLRNVCQVTVKKSTQLGFTEALYNVIAYHVDQDPSPMMLVLPTEDDVTKIGEERLKPVFEESPTLARYLSRRRRDWKQGVFGFGRCKLMVVPATSPRALRSWPVRLLFGDEVGAWPMWSGREAGPLDLARQRTSNFHNAKVVIGSTPTTRDNVLEKEWLASDRRRYWVPCPHCGAFQVLRWERVELFGIRDPQEMRRSRAARYMCEGCTQPIEDHHKPAMLAAGRWVPEAWAMQPDGTCTPQPESDHRGYHLNALYSPWYSFSQIAARWIADHRDPEKLANFVNNFLGEVWEERVEAPTKEKLWRCVSTHQKDDVPDGARLLVAGVDVQKTRAWYAIWGWGLDEEAWLIRSGWVADLHHLDELLFKGGWGEAGRRVRVVCMDARHRREEVYDIARRYPDIVRPIQGVERDDANPWTTTKVDKHPTTGAAYPRTLILWSCNVGVFKDKVAAHLAVGSKPGVHRAVHLHVNPDPEFMAHMESEHKVIVRGEKTRRPRERWVPKEGHRANHLWDCTVYAFAAADLAKVHLQTRERLARRQARRQRFAERAGRRGGGAPAGSLAEEWQEGMAL